VFALAKFNRGAAASKGLIEGQGTIIHFTIPTKAPWIPLRILALGKAPLEIVDADLFVLTDGQPWFAPNLGDMDGMKVLRNEAAGEALLQDLRSDRGMAWLPANGMWLTALRLHTTAGRIDRDLSIDGGGPAGLVVPRPAPSGPWWATWLTVVVGGLALATLWILWRPVRQRPQVAAL
jgi:hypothetical protein